ncbi:MAG: DMT family transporter [Candidatus Kerfeldbacteria bacterium]|nr:DMT family transporter [Candidatus Kerfeldbacteria bacterium]
MNKAEKLGTIILFAYAVIGGLFPIFGKLGVSNMPALLYIGSSVLVSAGLVFIIDLWQRGWRLPTFTRKQLKLGLLNSVFNLMIPYCLYFIGAQYTSSINGALLLRSEILFTILLTPLFGEPTTKNKLLGAGGILIGSIVVLYQGGLNFNIGDILIFLAPLSFPIGNWYGKRIVGELPPSTVLFMRSAAGGAGLLLISLVFEHQLYSSIPGFAWYYVLLNAIVIMVIGKLLWFHGLKLLDISKAVSIVNMEPLFTILFALAILGETVTGQQLIGIAIMLVGLYFTVRRKSVTLPPI